MKAVEIYRRRDGVSVVFPSITRASAELGITRRTLRNRVADGYAVFKDGQPLHVRYARTSVS